MRDSHKRLVVRNLPGQVSGPSFQPNTLQYTYLSVHSMFGGVHSLYLYMPGNVFMVAAGQISPETLYTVLSRPAVQLEEMPKHSVNQSIYLGSPGTL